MSEDKKNNHNIIMKDRSNIKATGIVDVISFDEEMIVAETELGILIIKGLNLHVSKLDLSNAELDIDGDIYSLIYEDKSTYGKVGGGIFSKIFK